MVASVMSTHRASNKEQTHDVGRAEATFFSDNKPACPLRGHWVSFCLADELGVGTAYGGLPYTLHDSAGQEYKGRLDGNGFATLKDIYCGPVALVLTTCVQERSRCISN